jgi:hypothetical protein
LDADPPPQGVIFHAGSHSKEQTDIRDDIRATEEVLAFITEAGAKSVVMTDRIIGCPMKKASITTAPPVRLACSGRDGTAGPANACTSTTLAD